MMSKKRRAKPDPTPRRNKRAEPDQPSARQNGQGRSTAFFLAAAIGLWVCRLMFPSEAAAEGVGLAVSLLWLLLLVFWLLYGLRERGGSLRLYSCDWWFFALWAVYGFATVRAAIVAEARPAINTFWLWSGYLACYFLFRQLVGTAKQVRAIVVLVSAAAVMLAAYGIFQYAYEMPQMRQLYRQDPERALREAGIWAAPGSRERKLFEQRLESREPIATFALTNTLAGFLVPPIVLAAGIVLVPRKDCQRSGRKVISVPVFWTALAVVALCTGCLVLTKSRSAFIATAIGLASVAAFCRPGTVRRSWPLVLAVLLILGSVGYLAWVLGLWDPKVLREAPKSFLYRVQYWQATLGMIADRPLLGVGPGNFQAYYTRYMLPEASEEISDPHNAFLEICASAGMLALVCFLGLLISFFVQLRKAVYSSVARPDNADVGESDKQSVVVVLVGGVLGAVLGAAVAAIDGLPPGGSVYLVGGPVAAVVVAGLWRWIELGSVLPAAIFCAVAALLVNLMAAGAVEFAAIGNLLWLLVALGLALVEQPHPRPIGKRLTWGLRLVGVAAVLGCYWTAYRPTLLARIKIQQALVDPDKADQYLQEAVRADPLASLPVRLLGQLSLERFVAAQDDRSLKEFEYWANRLALLSGQRSTCWHQLAKWYWQAFLVSGKRQLALKALHAYRRAEQLYPTNPTLFAEHALAAWHLQEKSEARKAAEKALQLHELTPHRDRKLPETLREKLVQILANVTD